MRSRFGNLFNVTSPWFVAAMVFLAVSLSLVLAGILDQLHHGFVEWHTLFIALVTSFSVSLPVLLFVQEAFKRFTRDISVFAKLFEREPNAVLVFDTETCSFETVNRAATELLGYSKNEFLRLKVPDISADKDQTCELLEKLKERAPVESALPSIPAGKMLRKDGTTFFADIWLGHVKIEGRNKIIVMMEDITYRREVEEKLKESESRYRMLFDHAVDGILLVEVETKMIVKGNARLLEMLRCDEEKLKTMGVNDIHPPQDLPFVLEQFERQSRKEIQYAKDIPVLRTDGTVFYADFNAAPVEINGKTCLMGIVRDISERRKIEEDLLESNRKLKNALEQVKRTRELLIRSEKLASIGVLSAGVAHEILNPLNIISTIGQVLKTEDLPPEAQEPVEQILVQVKRATRITDNLKRFAHPRGDEYSPVDVNELFDRTSTLIEHDLAPENITIERNYLKDIPKVYADQGKLSDAFLNLLTNSRDALKEKRKGGRITITTKADENGVHIAFSDNGPGIPENIRQKIFDPFFTTKDPGEGTGLGLSIVHSTIEGHNGTVKVESREGEGTTFYINLPRMDMTATDTRTEARTE